MPHFPEEDSKLRATDFESRRGGNCPNSLEVLQQLVTDDDGVCLHLVTCLPDKASTSTRRIIESFGPHSSIEFSKCLYREGSDVGASSYIIKSGSSDSRTIVNYNPLHEMTVQEFSGIIDSFAGDSETWWHFEVGFPGVCRNVVTDLTGPNPRYHAGVHPTAAEEATASKNQRRDRKAGARRAYPAGNRGGRCLLLANLGGGLCLRKLPMVTELTVLQNRGYKSAEECLKGEQRRKG